jgi:hypothetical protein
LRFGAGLWQRGDWFLSHERSGGGPLIDRALDLIGFPHPLKVNGHCFAEIGREVAARMGKSYVPEDLAIGLIQFTEERSCSWRPAISTTSTPRKPWAGRWIAMPL